MQPLYSTPLADKNGLLKVILASLFLGIAAGIAVAVLDSFWLGMVLIATFGFSVLLIHLILPRRLEVWPDRLALVFPVGTWNIRMDTVETVRPAQTYESYAFIGVRFATAPAKAVVVVRKQANLFGRPSIVVSPEEKDHFLMAMNSALDGQSPGPARP